MRLSTLASTLARAAVPARGLGLVRVVALALAAGSVLLASACSANEPSAATPATGAPSPASSASGGQAATTADPCALVTAADIKTAFGQTVSDTERYETTTDETGTTARCALITDGKPTTGAVFDDLSTLTSGFTGKALTSQPGASVGVILVTGTAPYDASAGDIAKLPTGSKTIAGLGTFAVVLAVPAGGGIGFAQTSPTEMVVVYDLEDRVVPAAQVEALLRTAVSRL